MSDLEWFFRNPRDAPDPSKERFSQLYLVRRDIDTCFGNDPTTGERIASEAIWAGTMAVLAAIDLLGKFLAGTDKTPVRQRFTDFVVRYFGLSNRNEAYLIYQLRNSLLHSFGLYSETSDKKGNVTAVYNFVLTRGPNTLIIPSGNNFYKVDVQCLRERFEKSVAEYEAELRDTSRSDHQDLNKNFNLMFPKHAKPMIVS